MKENMYAIEVQDVVLRFTGITVLDHVSMKFKKGSITGIIGRNGSGKTMLFKCICGFVSVDEGSIIIDGKKTKRGKIPDNIGIIIETPGFLPSMSGYRNLKLLADINGIVKKQQIKACMELVGLDPKLTRHVGKYSLGMRQRLGIAQAIMENPDILILDEPMNGLDNKGVEEVRALLLKLRDEGKTILLASHNKSDIAALCETVYELDHGSVISENSVVEQCNNL